MLRLAGALKEEQSLLVFGRGYNYATALEAALKVGAPGSGWFLRRLLCKHKGAQGTRARVQSSQQRVPLGAESQWLACSAGVAASAITASALYRRIVPAARQPCHGHAPLHLSLAS